MIVERVAPAKINLALHVTGQRPDGFHTIDTLVVFTELGDRITVREQDSDGPPIGLTITSPFSNKLPVRGNIILKAATSLFERFGDAWPSVQITLEKNLPVASGIGGGSADAAATLLALKEFWQLDADINLIEIAAELGADVPMCLHSRPLRAQGIGEQITLPETANAFHVLLVNPGVEVSTPAVFERLESKINPPISKLSITQFPDTGYLATLRNDLEAPALDIAPVIGEVLSGIRGQQGCLFSRMSGSGATCFGIFDSREASVQAMMEIQRLQPDWWCVATRTILA